MSDFAKALEEFRAVASIDGDEFKCFADAYLRLKASLEALPSEEFRRHGNSARHKELMRQAQNTFREERAESGKMLSSALVLGYMDDAIRLMQRSPELQGDVGLLFDPHSEHIRALKHAVALLKDKNLTNYITGGRAFVAHAKEAAEKIETAIDKVWESVGPEIERRSARTRYEVTGYSAISGYREGHLKDGLALVRRLESGEGPALTVLPYNRTPDANCTVIVGSEAILPHILENNAFSNALGAYMLPQPPFKSRAICVVNRDGATNTFNAEPVVAAKFRGQLDRSDNQQVREYNNKATKRWKEAGINTVVTQEDVDFVEQTFVPHLQTIAPIQPNKPQPGFRRKFGDEGTSRDSRQL